MFISAHTHVETAISASPMQAFVNKAKVLGRTHFTYTDYGYMTGAFKSYKMAKDAGLGFIPGIEMMFLDKDCVSAKAVPKAKYFSITAYAHDKGAYHALAAVSSGKGSYFVAKTEDEYPIYTWKDLEELSKHNVSFVLSGATSLYYRVYGKDKEAAKSVAKKLKDLGRPVFIAVVAGDEKEAWSEVVSIRTKKGVSDLSMHTRIDTNAASNIPAKDVMAARHTHILAIYKNGLRVESKEPMEIKDKKISYKATKLSKNYTKDANLAHVSLAKEMGLGLLASDYASMANKEDREVQIVRLEGRKPPGSFFMMSEVEYRECVAEHGLLQADIDTAIEGSKEWASTFNVELKYDWQLPTHPEPEKEMVRLFRKVGRLEKFKNDKVYMDRLKYELEVLRKNGVIDLLHYFFPIASYIDYVESKGALIGPGRGSAAGSLLAYFMGIHSVDPIKAKLPFERFFSLDRIKANKIPDIDLDSQDKLFLMGEDGNSGWLFETYGDRAAQISTRQNMRLKSAIKDVNRVKNDGSIEKEIEILSEKLPNPPQGVSDYDYLFGYKDSEGNSVRGLFETNKDLKEYAAKRPDEWDTVKNALGISRTMGRHASAVVIADRPINETVPTMQVGSTSRVTQYEAKQCEDAGLIKYDFLGVSQLADISACLALINSKNKETHKTGFFTHEGTQTHIWDLPQNDSKTASLLKTDNLSSLFQISTATAAPLVKAIEPQNVNDLAVILALGRPGPLDFIDSETGRNMAEEYIERRKGRSKGKIEALDKALEETFGVMCIKKGSYVKTKDGNVKIEDVKPGSLVQTEDGSFQKVLKNLKQGIKKTIKIRTDNGEELELTRDHKVLTNLGWQEAGSLRKNSLIKSFWYADGDIVSGDERDYIVGMLLADGNLAKQSSYNIAAGSEENAKKIKEIADKAWDLDCVVFFNQRCWYVRLSDKKSNKIGRGRTNKLRAHISSLGLEGTDCYTKFWPKNVSMHMLYGLLDGDGNLKNRTYRTVNENLARGAFYILQSQRIKSNLFQEANGVWVVRWGQDIPSLIKQNRQEGRPSKGLFIPVPEWSPNKIRRNSGNRSLFYKREGKVISMSSAQKMAKEYGLELKNNEVYSRVLSIKDGSEQEVYDLSVENLHSFVVGGLVVHNCYQENLTTVAKDVALMSGERAEILRDNMCKKRKKALDAMKPEFMDGAIKNVGEKTANEIWDMMVTFGQYGFSLNHAQAYATTTYATAFLKAHYPLEWWTAVLSNADQKEITEKFWKHVRHLIAPPDINISSDKMEIDYDKGLIRSKLSLVKGLSDDTAAKIMSQRPYKDIKDFVSKDVLKPAMTRKLIHVGIMDSLFPSKSTLEDKMQLFEDTLEEIKYEKAIAAGKKTKLKKGSVDPEFLSMSPLESYVLKKKILPSMPTDLTGLLTDISNDLDPQPGNRAIVKNSRGTYLFNGNMVEKAEKADLTRQVFYAAACYVISMKEFTYSGGTKKALKLLVDTDGYLREYVKWPNYDTGELEYPEGLRKESVAILLLERRPGKDPRIERILLQS